MAVRFLPPPEDRTSAHRDEGENLAEVVEMRSWLRPAATADHSIANQGSPDEPSTDQWPAGHESMDHESAHLDLADAESTEQSQELASLLEERGPVYDDAVRLLSRRARSSGELQSELLALGHPADEVSIIIDEFIDSHYLDDLGLARAQSEKLRDAKGASRGQIQRKLRERRLPDHVIDEVLGELDVEEEYALLRDAAEKRAEKLSGLDRATAQRRLLGFLARRGWSGEPAMRAVNEALSGTSRSRGSVRFE